MILSNINKYLIILSTILLVNSNIGFNMEKHNSNNINNSQININSDNNCININQTHEKVSRNLNMISKTNTIPEQNPFPNCLVKNSNKIIVRNKNIMKNPNISQVSQYKLQFPTVVYKKVLVRRKDKKLTNKKVTKNTKEIYNENNLKTDIDYFEKGIFYESNPFNESNPCNKSNINNNNIVIRDWNIENDHNKNINLRILDKYINFMYNNIETNLNIKIENIIHIINNPRNTNNYTYYK